MHSPCTVKDGSANVCMSATTATKSAYLVYNSTGAVSPTPADASPSGSTQSRAISRSIHPSRSSNRSENLILFGLPEASLLATKSDLDDVSNHLIGRAVEVLDAFCLGRKPNLPNAAANPSTRPRPLLIKCASA